MREEARGRQDEEMAWGREEVGWLGLFPLESLFFLFFGGITADNHAMCDVRRSRENRECW